MKNSILKFLLILPLFMFVSCNDDDTNSNESLAPTNLEFSAIKEVALSNIMQTYSFDASTNTYLNFTSSNGVDVYISTSCLMLNGNTVTSGTIDIEYAEIFEGGNMITTNKPTMGLMSDGNKALLISGGEFYLNATLNGEQLDIYPGCISVTIPTSLTSTTGGDTAMTLWEGILDTNGDLTWEEFTDVIDPTGQLGGVFVEGGGYYVFVNTFGWTNVDVFYNDERPKTTILVDVPDGYDNENSAVYLHYDGQGNALAHLDVYIEDTGLFSEHYGQIPIGLECHIIFVSESDGDWLYAIKPVTIAADTTYTFDLSETLVVTEAELISIVNALP